LERSRSARDDGQQGVRGASPEDTANSTELVRDAVEAAFGGMGDMAERVIVQHTAGLGCVTVAWGEGDDDRELIPVNIVDAYRPDGMLPYLDWDLWAAGAGDQGGAGHPARLPMANEY
jgi:hypothetical protein